MTTTIMDLMAFVFCTGSAILACRLWLWLAKNKCFLPIAIALMYASCLRLIILLIDFELKFGITKGNVQIMFAGFYIFLFIGFYYMCHGLKKFLKPPQKIK